LGVLTVSFFYGDRLSACPPTPTLEDHSTLFITLGAAWPSYTPRHGVPILIAFYDLHGPQWDFFSPVTTRGETNHTSTHNIIDVLWLEFIIHIISHNKPFVLLN